MRIRSVLRAIPFLGVLVPVTVGAFEYPLTPTAIQDAIRAAVENAVPTYDLKWRRPNVTTAASVGRVYTPWLRVAHYARSHFAAGRIISPEDVPEELSRPILLVGIFDNFPEAHTLAETSEPTIEVIPREADNRARGPKPIWIRRDTDATAFDTSDHLPFIAVAAFDLAVVRPGLDFIFRVPWGFPPPLHMAVRRGTVYDQDFAVWR